MIIIRMAGGLGNQMFQYALYEKLRSMGKEVKFDDINEYRGERAKTDHACGLWNHLSKS